MKNTPLCTMYSLICYPSRSALLSQEYFVLLPLLSSTQLFPSNKYRTAHKQFVIGGNEFLIIETDNVLWHLEQCCFSALLRARASPNVIIVATIIYQCQLGQGVFNQCATKIRFWYREPKPSSDLGIGIRAEFFFRNQNFSYFLMFFCLLRGYRFLKV